MIIQNNPDFIPKIQYLTFKNNKLDINNNNPRLSFNDSTEYNLASNYN